MQTLDNSRNVAFLSASLGIYKQSVDCEKYDGICGFILFAIDLSIMILQISSLSCFSLCYCNLIIIICLGKYFFEGWTGYNKKMPHN